MHAYPKTHRQTKLETPAIALGGHLFFAPDSPLIAGVAYKQSSTVRLTRTNQFDGLNRLTNLVWSAGGATVASFAYQYNDANQRTRATLADGSYWQYQYDLLGQVTVAKKYWSDGTPVAGQQTTFVKGSVPSIYTNPAVG